MDAAHRSSSKATELRLDKIAIVEKVIQIGGTGMIAKDISRPA
jgi:hypothetical protein